MATIKLSRAGFERVNKLVDGRYIAYARFTCASCYENHLDILMNKGMNPEALAKTARRQGWEADDRRASQCRCPSCIDKARGRAGGQSPKVVEFRPVTPEPVPAVSEAILAAQAALEAEGVRPGALAMQMQQAAQAAAPAPVPAAPDKPRATAFNKDTRAQALEWLDEFFDAPSGRYRRGYSDTLVAADIGVEDVLIAGVREAMFGPLAKIDAEALTAEMVAAEAEVAQVAVQVRTTLEQAKLVIAAAVERAQTLVARIDAIKRELG